MGCTNYNCDDLGTHIAGANCGRPTQGGAQDWVILDCDATTTDASNAAQINVDIAAGRAVVVTGVQSGFAKPSPITLESISSCGGTITVNNDWTGTIKDGSINNQTIDFWNRFIRGRSAGSIIMRECHDDGDDEYVTWVNPPAGITFQGGRVLPDKNNQAQIIDLEFKWRELASPLRWTAPVGVTGWS
jgi:hypothetical protein